MISSNKSPKSQNTLVNRLQRYAQASAIFRSTDSDDGSVGGSIQRSATAPSKAIMLSGPSTLPIGRTVPAQGVGSVPFISDAFLPAPPVSSMPLIDPAAAAIEHVTQVQRSPAPQVFTSPQVAPEQVAPEQVAPEQVAPERVAPEQAAPAPLAESSASEPGVVQAAPKSEDDLGGAWGRLQRIFKGHEEKKASSETAAPTTPDVQRAEMRETAVSPPSPPAIQPSNPIQPPAKPKQAPLSSVWPVERVEPEGINDEPVVMRQPDTPISTEPVQSPDQLETIRTKLSDVSASRQSDSSIELHLPRRPRPAPVPDKPKQEDANKAFWDRLYKRESEEPAPVQRTIDTEIGPLPADMWEILGEKPPETAAGGDASSSTIQAKPMETEAAATTSEPVSKEMAAGETAVPPFLAERSTKSPPAQPTTDAVQRAIAAVETPQASPKPVEETAVSTGQPKETTAATTAAPEKAQPAADNVPVTTPPTVAPTHTGAEPVVQRLAETSVEGDAVPVKTVEQSAKTEAAQRPAEASTAPEQSTTSETTNIQRAIAAAEAPTTPKPETAIPAAQTVQPKQADSDASPTKTTLAVLPEPKFQSPGQTDNDDTPGISKSMSVETTTAAQRTVDLNAETGPLPPLPAEAQTAVP
ncbi:MAG: hypothetical protein IAF02_12325, partial [Anaerolineae bacterium]|nr:hypothetical protein [Anaerolineae bacterium]